MKYLFSLLLVLTIFSTHATASTGDANACLYKFGQIQQIVFARITAVKCTGEGGPAGETIHSISATGMVSTDGSVVRISADDSEGSVNSASSIAKMCESLKKADKSKAAIKVIGQYYENQNEDLPDGTYFSAVFSSNLSLK